MQICAMFFGLLLSITSYVVQPGDTLWRISQRFGVTVEEIAVANSIVNVNLIYAGHTLRLPNEVPELTSAAASSSLAVSPRSEVVNFALSQVGKPYVWGGNGPYGYDCSGLVQEAYRHVGIELPRIAQAQRTGITPVSEPQPGDIVFFGRSYTSHVAIALGDGRMVHANTRYGRVTINYVSEFFGIGFLGYGRVNG